MNDLGLTLLGAAVRVTLLALAAVPLCTAASRRGPRAGAAAATAGLAGCVALTALAFCPLPDWWSWGAPSGQAASPVPPAPGAGDLPTAEMTTQAGGGVSLADVAGLFAGLGRRAEEAASLSPRPAAGWPAWVAVTVLCGAGVGLLRLALGLWAVARARRRSRPVHDGPLLRLAEGLRAALGCRRRVAIRESDEVAVPATAGWLRPLVLLPADWRAWGEGDLRAVLAHELAHVRRSDYLAGLLARLGVALHFYHPLVRWLAGRLRLEQELAADALGARLAGGRGPYLRALARLALRRDGQPPGPGRAFLSAGGTLERRIHMLRTRTSGPERAPSWAGRVAAGLLLAAAFAASGLRGPALTAAAAPPAEPATAGAEAIPFDLSALPPDAKGVWAFRPAAFFGKPGMKKYADEADSALAFFCKEGLNLDKSLLPTVEHIEQVVGTVTLAPLPGDTEHTALMADLRLIRATRDFAWKDLLAGLFPKAAEVRAEGGSYYRVPSDGLPDFFAPLRSTKLPFICYHIADARTVVFGNEDDMRRRLSGEKAAPPQRAWAAEWKAVERDLIAVAYDGRDKAWMGKRGKPKDAEEAAAIGIAEKTSAIACGLGAADGLSATVAVRCPTAEDAKQVRRLIGDLFKEDGALRVQFQASDAEKHADNLLLRALLKNDWKVSQAPAGEDCCITWQCRSPMGLPALIEAMVGEGKGQESKPPTADRP
jgi:hypothetical protein